MELLLVSPCAAPSNFPYSTHHSGGHSTKLILIDGSRQYSSSFSHLRSSIVAASRAFPSPSIPRVPVAGLMRSLDMIYLLICGHSSEGAVHSHHRLLLFTPILRPACLDRSILALYHVVSFFFLRMKRERVSACDNMLGVKDGSFC